MKELLEVGMIVAFKIESRLRHKTFWIAGRIEEIRSDSYLLKIAFSADLPFKFSEIIDIKILEHTRSQVTDELVKKHIKKYGKVFKALS